MYVHFVCKVGYKSKSTVESRGHYNILNGKKRLNIHLLFNPSQGAQWLSGRVLDSRPRGRGFEPHRRHCVVVFKQDTFILA